jgi:hypothetical protein
MGEAKEVNYDFEGLSIYPQMAGLRSLMAEEKNIEIFFTHDTLLISLR